MSSSIAEMNARWAAAIIGGLAASGVKRVVVSPGSRSTPLTLAALADARVSVEVVLDERSAAFFALGSAKAEGRPVALICTSGSAVANWHPAVIEADKSMVPLILLSADRPPELQDCGANQTIDQTLLFGRALRGFHALPPAEAETGWLVNLMAQCMAESLWPLPGPVQINVALREPLLGEEGQAALPVGAADGGIAVRLPKTSPTPEVIADLARRIEGKQGVIVCGIEAMPVARIAQLAAALDVPVLADPLSGLRFGAHDCSHVMVAYDLFLRTLKLVPDYVLRFGAPPVSKPLAQWVAKSGAAEMIVARPGRWPDPSRSGQEMLFSDYDEAALALAGAVRAKAPPEWMSSFLKAEADAQAAARRIHPPEADVIAHCLSHLPESSLLFVGNSMAIRDLDGFSGLSDKALTVMGNRGASGIDGNLSTFLGAAATGRYARSLALVGDLTFLHDLGGLASARTDAVICVLANGGGAIFDYLPPGRVLPRELYEKSWLTPQSADLGRAAQAFGCAHRRVGLDDFSDALVEALSCSGVSVLEITIDRVLSVERHRALWTSLAQVVENE